MTNSPCSWSPPGAKRKREPSSFWWDFALWFPQWFPKQGPPASPGRGIWEWNTDTFSWIGNNEYVKAMRCWKFWGIEEQVWGVPFYSLTIRFLNESLKNKSFVDQQSFKKMFISLVHRLQPLVTLARLPRLEHVQEGVVRNGTGALGIQHRRQLLQLRIRNRELEFGEDTPELRFGDLPAAVLRRRRRLSSSSFFWQKRLRTIDNGFVVFQYLSNHL